MPYFVLKLDYHFRVDIFVLNHKLCYYCLLTYDIGYWSSTCTTEQSSLSNSEPDSHERQVRIISLMKHLVNEV